MSVPALRFRDELGRDFTDWIERELQEVAEINPKTGLLPNEFVYIDLESVEKGILLKETVISKDDAPSRAQRLLNKEDILFQTVRPYQGNNLFFHESGDYVASTGYAQIRTSENSRFLYQYLHLEDFTAEVMNRCTGTSYPAINSSGLATILINFPTKPEQTKIANFLTAVDEKIHLLTQKHDLLTQYKKGVMQQIFSQELRFKDDDGQDFPEWEEKEVGEVFKVTRGNVLAMPLVSETKTDTHQFPVYSSQTKNNGLSGYYNEHLYENSITWTTDGANAGDVNFRDGKFYCTNVCGVLISEDGHANACIAAMINAVSRKYVSYVGNPKLMNGVMAKIAIEFPCVKEQTKISNFLTAIDDKITATQTQLQAVKQYKQGLLQQMFV